MAARPRSTVKALLLPFRNANGAQHGVHVCLLNETHLDPRQAFWFAYYVRNRTDRSKKGAGKAILFRRGIKHHALPVPGQQHLLASAIELNLAGKPTKILAVYLSPCRPLIKSHLTACLSGGLPVLMAGDLNAKHVDWNSRLTNARGKLLRDHADRRYCLIHGPDPSTTLQTLCNPRCPRHRGNQKPSNPGASVFHTKFRSLTHTDRYQVSNVFVNLPTIQTWSEPTGPSSRHAWITYR
jgi:hypothetical protein